MQFVFSSESPPVPAPPLPPPGGDGDADAAAARDAALFGGDAPLLGHARGVLERTSLADYLAARPRRAIAALDMHMTVGDALRMLDSHKVSGTPVFDVHKRRFITVLDTAAYLHAFLTALPTLCAAAADEAEPSAAALQEAGDKFARWTLDRVCPPEAECDGENLALDTTANASLLDVVASVFLRPARGHRRAVAHRAVVFAYAPDAALTDFGWRPCLALDIVAVLSQSDLVRELNAHAAELGAPLRAATVTDLQLGAAPVRCVAAGTSALAAFRAMAASDLSAVGILSPTGTLIGNLSASDLRGLLPHQFGRLALPVARFVAEQSAESLMVVAVPPRATLGAVLDRMVHARVHHVYVVNDAGQPLRMITPTDILRLLTPPSEFSVAEREPISRQLAQATAAKASAAYADAEARRTAERGAHSPPSADELERAAAELAQEVGAIMQQGGATPTTIESGPTEAVL